jgi:uncharacterized protein YjiS (DUF1127 family)
MSQATPRRSAMQLTPTYEPQDSSLNRPARWLPSVRLLTERYRQRRALFNLIQADPHLLNDIGLSRHDALREATKSFWRR